jgi:hypothetical protein
MSGDRDPLEATSPTVTVGTMSDSIGITVSAGT